MTDSAEKMPDEIWCSIYPKNKHINSISGHWSNREKLILSNGKPRSGKQRERTRYIRADLVLSVKGE